MRKTLWLLLIYINMPLMGQVSELNKHYLQGQELFKQKKYDEAINSFIYCNSIKNDPLFAFWLAYTYANKQDYLNCKKYYETVIAGSNNLKSIYREKLPEIKAWLDSNNESFRKEIELSGFINGSWIDETPKDSVN
jgi:tetratricopeptide (TPR) repeat protein